MTQALMIAWLALTGADRVDLFAGAGPVLLTPFLVLTPLVILAHLARAFRRSEAIAIPQATWLYAAVASAFLFVGLVSLFPSEQSEIGLRRIALLIFQVYGTLLGVIFLCSAANWKQILVRAAYVGLAIGLIFNVIQVHMWLTGQTADMVDGGKVFFLAPWTYGPWVPRLSGPAIDMNRGGFLFLVYLFVLVRFARPSLWRASFIGLAGVMIFATLSRSVMMALAIMAVLLVVQSGRTLSISRRGLVAGTGVVAAVSLAFLAVPRAFEAVIDFAVPPLLLRLMGDGSSNIHFALIQYGAELGSSSLRNAIFGVGFGNSFVVLEEFFPGNKYGNFHSLYLAYWVEMGAFGLLLGTLLLVYPFLRSSTYRPLFGALLMFNVFYQSNSEPLFWFVIAAAWMKLGEGAHGAGRATSTRVAHRAIRNHAGGWRVGKLAGVATVCFLLAGCSDVLPPSYEYSTIEVQASRLNGEPVEGVVVTLYAFDRDIAYGRTGLDGRYVFRFVPFGNFGVAAGPPPGFRFPGPSEKFAFVDGIDAIEGSDTAVTFQLLKEGVGSIRVLVEGPSGVPIPGVTFELYTFFGGLKTGASDSSGTHLFDAVASGEYGVLVFPPPGFILDPPYRDGILVEGGSESALTFLLNRCEGSLRVEVRDTDAMPVAGAEARLYSPFLTVGRQLTDGSGGTSFTGIGCAQIGVELTPPSGYETLTGESSIFKVGIEVGRGDEQVVTFELRKQ